jgi:hypothetical protein
MEDLGFDHVNDYLQYAQGWDGFFGNPQLSILTDDYSGIDPYANVIVCMYFYYFALDTASIAFIRAVFSINEQTKMPFDRALEAAASSVGTTWPGLLNAFHTASFFSGTRADTTRFIPDASLLPSWNYGTDTLDDTKAMHKDIGGYAMQTFVYRRGTNYADTLFIQLAGTQEDAGGMWAAHVILTDTAGSYSVLPMPLQTPSTARLSIPDWGRYSEALAIVSNAAPLVAREASTYYTDYRMDDLYLPDEYEIYPNPVKLQSQSVLRIRGKNVIDVRVHSVDGNLVAHADVYAGGGGSALRATGNGFDWFLCNKDGETVVPGTYIAVVAYKDVRNNSLERNHTSVLVLP